MEKYEKLFKGLEMCAGPECSEECPYHGETRGGKTCRAWLLHDALAALAMEANRADTRQAELEARDAQKKPEPGLDAVMETALKATMRVEYWRGQADAMKDFLRDLFEGRMVEDDEDVEPETEADGHV